MTTPNAQTRIGDLVKNQPEAMSYFESVGIDYCCGGHRPLRGASLGAESEGFEITERLGRLIRASSPSPRQKIDRECLDGVKALAFSFRFRFQAGPSSPSRPRVGVDLIRGLISSRRAVKRRSALTP